MLQPFTLKQFLRLNRRYRLTFWLGWLLMALNYGCVGQVPKALYVVSGSMEPTLAVDDRLLVTSGSYRHDAPQRGDIVIFTPPPAVLETMPGLDHREPWLFRVVGLPGETFEVRDGETLIDEAPLPEPYISESPAYTFEPVTIPEEAYIVLGDNRNNAFDSHAWGFLHEDNITGRVQSIYWPLGRFGSVYD